MEDVLELQQLPELPPVAPAARPEVAKVTKEPEDLREEELEDFARLQVLESTIVTLDVVMKDLPVVAPVEDRSWEVRLWGL